MLSRQAIATRRVADTQLSDLSSVLSTAERYAANLAETIERDPRMADVLAAVGIDAAKLDELSDTLATFIVADVRRARGALAQSVSKSAALAV